VQCLVATILSAQCTDKRVNQVTPRLFAEIPDVRAMNAAPAERIERLILDTGFFRQKTRSLKGAARESWSASAAKCRRGWKTW